MNFLWRSNNNELKRQSCSEWSQLIFCNMFRKGSLINLHNYPFHLIIYLSYWTFGDEPCNGFSQWGGCVFQSFLYIAWYFSFSVLGNYNPFFFAAHLLDVAICFKTLGTILQSVTHNGKQVSTSSILVNGCYGRLPRHQILPQPWLTVNWLIMFSCWFIMPLSILVGRRHYVFGLSIHPFVCPSFFPSVCL